MSKLRTILTVLMVCLVMLVLTVIAADNDKIQSITETSTLEDGAWVTIQGNITEKLRDDYFLLVDETGEIELKIRGDEWGRYSYDPVRKVEVFGKLIQEEGIVKLEVQKITYIE